MEVSRSKIAEFDVYSGYGKESGGFGDFAKARQYIAKMFKEYPSFKFEYIANIAMLIYDDQMQDNKEHRTDLETVKGCSSMAERILKLIFEG